MEAEALERFWFGALFWIKTNGMGWRADLGLGGDDSAVLEG